MQKHLTKHFNTQETPQSQPIPGSTQVQNSAGGFSFEVSDWSKLDRFLILGTEGGTYYVSEAKLTADNANAVLNCIKKDGKRVVDRIVEISDGGRAPKNDYALYALAMASKLGSEDTRKYAYKCLPKVARIGTHLFNFAEYRQAFGGWGRGVREAVSNWYLEKEVDKLAYQTVKYRQRDGWTHADLLRLSHPKTVDPKVNSLFKWVLGKREEKVELPRIVEGYEKISKVTDVKTAASLIREYRLPHEAVPKELLSDKVVWEALFDNGIPMTALIRNLANLTRYGVFDNFSDRTLKAVSILTDEVQILNARIHPVAILAALRAYSLGYSYKDSSKQWTAVHQIVSALDQAFYLAFKNVVPSNKRIMLALDVSGSMTTSFISSMPGMSAREASSALAMVTLHTEPKCMIKGFSTTFMDLKIDKSMNLRAVTDYTERLPFSGTDCSLPVTEALRNRWEVDAFVVYTDSETWAGRIHPPQALVKYKKEMGIDAKFVVVAMTANNFSIADPDNPNMLDVVGFDSNTPSLISEFISS